MDFAGELPGTYYPDYVLQLGGNATSLGVITLGSMLALATVQFPGGYLADKYGRRWLISTFTFGVAFAYIFHTFAPSWHYILIGEIIRSLCLIYQPAINAMFADSLPSKKRGMGFSIINLIMSVSTTPAPVIALLLVTSFGPIRGMRVAYGIVMILFLIAAATRLKLKETVRNVEKPSLKEALISYPEALREGINVWRNVPSSMFFLFIASLIFRFSFTLTGPFILVYAFYVMQIGGAPDLSLPSDVDPALQLARERWGYVNIVLFVSMILLSLPIGQVIDKIGRKKTSYTCGTHNSSSDLSFHLWQLFNAVHLHDHVGSWGASGFFSLSSIICGSCSSKPAWEGYWLNEFLHIYLYGDWRRNRRLTLR